MLRPLLAAVLCSALFLSGAASAQPAFFKGLSGSWSGSGPVYVSIYGDIAVTCRYTISGTETQLDMKGSCGKSAFRQALGLSLRHLGGNKYAGTYTGSRTGPARLVGTLRGNRLLLSIRWGGLVNGDRQARLVLQRTGPQSFTQTVYDVVEGKRRTTSGLQFKRN